MMILDDRLSLDHDDTLIFHSLFVCEIMQIKRLKYTILFALTILAFSTASANNITVSNVAVTGQNISAGTNNASNYTLIQFDLAWENSWRVSSAPNNWDAAWVFAKYRIGGVWYHATLNTNGHTAPAGSVITPSGDGCGAFFYRASDGSGTFSKSGIQLRWNYGANGVSDNATVDVQVFAIEMVFVPQGAFALGSGGTGVAEFYKYPTTTNTFPINNENAIAVSAVAESLYYNKNTTLSGDQTGVLPAAFPKGYNAFYCMKYEISQQQYVEFLNTLTRLQQSSRVTSSVGEGTASVTNRYVMSGVSTDITRNGIRCDAIIPSSGPVTFYCDLNGNDICGESSDGLSIACGRLRYDDVWAYADWCGLRPMTELEYEKACRGTLSAVPDEYAWGSTLIGTSVYTLNNSGTFFEVPVSPALSPQGNSNNAVTKLASNPGPFRVGCFATAGSDRAVSGATYYGIMEMSGNLIERCVTVGSVSGRAYTGVHGNGVLDNSGNADVPNWTDVSGAGFRGGAYMYGTGSGNNPTVKISDRYYAARNNIARSSYYGGRGVRTAP